MKMVFTFPVLPHKYWLRLHGAMLRIELEFAGAAVSIQFSK
jgi:hypothetical protein